MDPLRSGPRPSPAGSGSLYIPTAHKVEDQKLLHDFIGEFAFADLVTAAPEIRISHIPTWLDPSEGPFGTIYGHVARQNPQSSLFDGLNSAVVVFRGPHAYISPSWYAKMGSVPTWNFAAVHATGKLRAVTGEVPFRQLLAKLVEKFEDPETSSYDTQRVPAEIFDGLMKGIVGFSLEVERLEGKFKLGQERSPADRAHLLGHLKSARPERSLHALTEEFYERREMPGGEASK